MHQDKIVPMTQTHPLSLATIPDLATLKAGFPGVKTLLFDMDGTLFDTEKYHTLALQKIGDEQKIHPPVGPKELHAMLMGKADRLVFELVKDWPGFPEHWDVHTFVNEKNRHLLAILAQVDPQSYFHPALKSLLKEAQGMNVGLVTSSEKVITEALLKLADANKYFSFVLTRDDSKEVKPDPWPYLHAMKNFAADPGTTIVFEDSQVGLTSARASGAHAVKAEWY